MRRSTRAIDSTDVGVRAGAWSILRALQLAFCTLVLAACADFRDWTVLERPWETSKLAAEPALRVQREDGPLEVLEHPHVDPGAPHLLVGEPRGRPGASVAIPIERIRTLEVRRVSAERVVTTVLVVALVVVAFSLIEFSPSAGSAL